MKQLFVNSIFSAKKTQMNDAKHFYLLFLLPYNISINILIFFMTIINFVHQLLIFPSQFINNSILNIHF